MISLFKPQYNKRKILEELDKLLDIGWTAIGPKTAELEELLARKLKVDFSVFTNSCTSALHLAIECLKLPPKSKIAVPDITFVSTASAVLYAGHIPVLVPVDDSIQIDLDYLEKLIACTKINCVIPVHYSGNCCDIERLLSLCKNIPIIEDCAHAMGSSYKSQPLGTFGDFGCFSFNAIKNLPIADGGLIVSKRKECENHLKKLKLFGIDRKTGRHTYNIDMLGYKYHGNDLMAVIALANLEILDKGNEIRRKIYQKYKLKEFGVKIHAINNNVVSSHHLITGFVQKRDEFIEKMQNNNIEVGIHYRPVSSFSFYEKFADEIVKKRSSKLYNNIVSLPVYPELTDSEQSHIIETARKCCAIL